MNSIQINSFIEAANKLQPGNFIEATFQTTPNAAKGLSTQRIKEIATQCLKGLIKEGKSCNALIKGLKNIESTLKETHCFDSIYAAVPKPPLEKLPNVILTKIFEYGTSEEWPQVEQTSKHFKNRIANDKVWEKEAKKNGLDGEQPKDAVLKHAFFQKVLPQFDGWAQRLNHEQFARRENLLHQVHTFQISNYTLQFTLFELIAYLEKCLNGSDPWLIGGAANHVLNGMAFADVDICFYIKNFSIKFIYDTIANFIKSKIPNIKDEEIKLGKKFFSQAINYDRIGKCGC